MIGEESLKIKLWLYRDVEDVFAVVPKCLLAVESHSSSLAPRFPDGFDFSFLYGDILFLQSH